MSDQPHLLRLRLNYNPFDYNLEGFHDVGDDVELRREEFKDDALGLFLNYDITFQEGYATL